MKKFENIEITKSIACGDAFHNESSFSELMKYIVSNNFTIDMGHFDHISTDFFIDVFGKIPYEQLMFNINCPSIVSKDEFILYLKLYKRGHTIDMLIETDV